MIKNSVYCINYSFFILFIFKLQKYNLTLTSNNSMETKSTKIKNFTNNYGVIMFSSLCFKRMYVIARSFQWNLKWILSLKKMPQITIPVVMVTFLGQRLRQPIVNACTFTIQRRLFSPESLSFGIISHLILI